MIYLREATIEDRDMLYEWVNDSETRANAFSTATICYEEHCKWFNRIMTDEYVRQYIMMDGDVAVGQGRLTIEGNAAEIDYSVAPDKRGHGYGNMLITIMKQVVNKDLPQIRKLVAKVKPKNAASIRCFENNGFADAYRQFEYNMTTYEDESETRK